MTDTFDLHKQHPLNGATQTIEQRRCWSVVFDVNGNAPSDATIASFATEELAKQAHALWAALKDDDKVPVITKGGVCYWGLEALCVEGYDFDTYYAVREDWQEDKDILTSLAQLTVLCSYEKPAPGQPDGITLLDEEPGQEDEE